jgi:hypothetical protein
MLRRGTGLGGAMGEQAKARVTLRVGEDGPDEIRATASIRLKGDDLVPSEVSALLGCAPALSYRKGEPMPLRGAKPPLGRTGFWSTNSGVPDGRPLEEHILGLIDKLPAPVEVWQRLGRKYRMDCFCAVFLTQANQGVELSAESLQWLRRLPHVGTGARRGGVGARGGSLVEEERPERRGPSGRPRAYPRRVSAVRAGAGIAPGQRGALRGASSGSVGECSTGSRSRPAG